MTYAQHRTTVSKVSVDFALVDSRQNWSPLEKFKALSSKRQDDRLNGFGQIFWRIEKSISPDKKN